jgi:hypothetical protein
MLTIGVACATGFTPTGKDGITCAGIKGIYRDNQCCDEMAEKEVDTHFMLQREADPPIPGVLQGKTYPHILLGMAPDYPPYTKWDTSIKPKKLSGFNYDFGMLMKPICGIDVDFVLAPWTGCWTTSPHSYGTEYVGADIWNGNVHGCTAYTHTVGEREYSLEFTASLLGNLKTAGILTRLENGKPVVSPLTTNYSDIKLGDVTGWAPTADTFTFNQNECVSGSPQFIPPATILTPGDDGNKPAIDKLLDGTFDALYIYADQLANGLNSNADYAAGFGQTFAYIHTGLNDWSINGTTLAISKRGSGLKDVLDPCIAKVAATKNYTTLCEHYFPDSTSSCIQNAYSSGGTGTTAFYDVKMTARTDSNTCSDGYCKCNELPASG